VPKALCEEQRGFCHLTEVHAILIGGVGLYVAVVRVASRVARLCNNETAESGLARGLYLHDGYPSAVAANPEHCPLQRALAAKIHMSDQAISGE
jgi:hypothetical protein